MEEVRQCNLTSIKIFPIILKSQSKAMTLTSKFSKDLSTLRAAANKEIFLDLKNPKLYKKVKRYYQNEVILDGEDPERDYSLVIECLRQDLAEVS